MSPEYTSGTKSGNLYYLKGTMHMYIMTGSHTFRGLGLGVKVIFLEVGHVANKFKGNKKLSNLPAKHMTIEGHLQ